MHVVHMEPIVGCCRPITYYSAMRVLLFGKGGHARTVAEAIAAEGKHDIAGVITDDGLPGMLLGHSILGKNEDATRIAHDMNAEGAVIALGDARARMNLIAMLGNVFSFPAIIHPYTWVSPSSTIGEGSVILAGAVIGSQTSIGKHCIINTNASVDHDCTVGDFTHFCPNTASAGYCTIGFHVWVGIGSTIVDHVTVPDNTFIKAGSLITTPRPPDYPYDPRA